MKNYCNGGKQNVPNGQAQRAVKMNMPMALVSQASRLDTHGILIGAFAASIAFVN